MKDDGGDTAIDPNLRGARITPEDGSGGVNGSAVDSPQDDGMGPPDEFGGPAPKRRRVTRACDECRRKKIKCDGKQVSPQRQKSLIYLAVHALCGIFIQYVP